MNLETFFRGHPKVAAAFSGGVDSAYLLHEAVKWGADVKAYFIKSQFQPAFELEDARRLAQELGVEMEVIELDVLADQQIAMNPKDRCYHCKNRIFSALMARAQADGYTEILDGTNGSDEEGDRPGMRALAEMEVLSPLRICGLSKEEIRRLSKEAGLFTWNKPSYACLATRIPSGQQITEDLLVKVEKAEAALIEMGFSDLRVRVFHGGARIQLPGEQVMDAVRRREEIIAKLKPWFADILLDMEGR
ncbi:MAG: ATP-dependent sacrificial sulfur transferase LarE [Firmicutes bacterium]|nr:ATP-dependent sacrificial sulfur transferase LarE [Bacillota bacterium]